MKRLSCVGALLLLPSLLHLGATEDPRAIIQSIGFDQNLDRQVPLDLMFKDENGTPVALQKYLGTKPVVLALVYYGCPMLCGAELTGLITCLRPMTMSAGKEFDIVTVSINPDETPDIAKRKKAEYVRSYGRPSAEQGFHFLTGHKASIDALAAAVGFRYRYDDASKQYAHPSGLIVLTPQGKVSRYLYGVEYYPRDLGLGLVESSQNKIGSATDQILLYCYRYDPMTGRYGLVILRILRIGGIATVLVLGVFMARMFLRDRRALAPVVSSTPAHHQRVL